MMPAHFPTLAYLENGNGWLGSLGILRYEVEYVAPKKDEGGAPAQLTAVLWYGPFSRPYAQEVTRESFPLTADGRTALLDYLDRQSEDFNAHPAFTPQETDAYYRACKRRELEPSDAQG